MNSHLKTTRSTTTDWRTAIEWRWNINASIANPLTSNIVAGGQCTDDILPITHSNNVNDWLHALPAAHAINSTKVNKNISTMHTHAPKHIMSNNYCKVDYSKNGAFLHLFLSAQFSLSSRDLFVVTFLIPKDSKNTISSRSSHMT